MVGAFAAFSLYNTMMVCTIIFLMTIEHCSTTKDSVGARLEIEHTNEIDHENPSVAYSIRSPESSEYPIRPVSRNSLPIIEYKFSEPWPLLQTDLSGSGPAHAPTEDL